MIVKCTLSDSEIRQAIWDHVKTQFPNMTGKAFNAATIMERFRSDENQPFRVCDWDQLEIRLEVNIEV